MSDTNKSEKEITCSIFEMDKKNKTYEIVSGDSSVFIGSNGTPGEIPFGKDKECTVSNENGKVIMKDPAGNVIGYLDNDGTINRKLTEKDKRENSKGMEH